MDQHYAESHYVEDLEALIKKHQLRFVDLHAEQVAAENFEPKLKTECDSIVDDIKKIDAKEDFESNESLQQEREVLSEKLIFMCRKLKFFRERIAKCKSEKEQVLEELGQLNFQRLHVSVVHNK